MFSVLLCLTSVAFAECSQSELDQSFGFGHYGTQTCTSASNLFGRAFCSMVGFTPCGCMCPGRSAADTDPLARLVDEVAELERSATPVARGTCTQSELDQSFGFGHYGTQTCTSASNLFGRAFCSMVGFTPCGCMCPGREVGPSAGALARLVEEHTRSITPVARGTCTQSELDQSFGFGHYGTQTCTSASALFGRAFCSMVSFTPCGCMCPGRAAADTDALARLVEEVSGLERSATPVARGTCTQSELDQSFGFGHYGTQTCTSASNLFGRAFCSMVSFTPCGCMCSGRAAADSADPLERLADVVSKLERAVHGTSKGARGNIPCTTDSECTKIGLHSCRKKTGTCLSLFEYVDLSW